MKRLLFSLLVLLVASYGCTSLSNSTRWQLDHSGTLEYFDLRSGNIATIDGGRVDLTFSDNTTYKNIRVIAIGFTPNVHTIKKDKVYYLYKNKNTVMPVYTLQDKR